MPIGALSGEPFVPFPPYIGSKVYEQTVRLCREAGFEPRAGQEALQIPTVLSLVVAGIGVALVPASVRSFHGSGVVYKPLADQPTPEAELAIAHRRDDASPVVTAFVRVAIQVAQNSDCRSYES